MPLPKKVYQGKIRKRMKVEDKYKRAPPGYKRIASGWEAIVFLNKRTGKVFRVEKNSNVDPIKRYYYHKIASLLFPGQVLEYSLAAREYSKTGVFHGNDGYGRVFKSNLHKTSKKYREYMRSSVGSISSLESNSKYSFRKIALEQWGIYIESPQFNIDIVNGKPFVFEVDSIALDVLKKKLNKMQINSEEDRKRNNKIRLYIKRLEYYDQLEKTT
jgi:hypothetical protein